MRILILLILAALTTACASEARLTVDEGQVFLLSDFDGPTDVAKVVDKRAQPLSGRSAEPLRVILGPMEVSPAPAKAIELEVARLLRQGQLDSQLATRLRTADLALEQFAIEIAAADVRDKQYAPGTPPGTAAIDALARAAGQSLVGGSDITVEFTVSLDGKPFRARGQGRYTARPGINATVWPFRRAVASLVRQLAPK